MKTDRCPTCKRRVTRSSEQNRRLWAIYHALSEGARTAGKRYSADQWHLYCKSRWLGMTDTELPDGSVISIPNSTKDLDVAAFSDYMTKIEAWANTQHDVYLEDMEGAA